VQCSAGRGSQLNGHLSQPKEESARDISEGICVFVMRVRLCVKVYITVLEW
jgi:hypothetical protein